MKLVSPKFTSVVMIVCLLMQGSGVLRADSLARASLNPSITPRIIQSQALVGEELDARHPILDAGPKVAKSLSIMRWLRFAVPIVLWPIALLQAQTPPAPLQIRPARPGLMAEVVREENLAVAYLNQALNRDADVVAAFQAQSKLSELNPEPLRLALQEHPDLLVRVIQLFKSSPGSDFAHVLEASEIPETLDLLEKARAASTDPGQISTQEALTLRIDELRWCPPLDLEAALNQYLAFTVSRHSAEAQTLLARIGRHLLIYGDIATLARLERSSNPPLAAIARRLQSDIALQEGELLNLSRSGAEVLADSDRSGVMLTPLYSMRGARFLLEVLDHADQSHNPKVGAMLFQIGEQQTRHGFPAALRSWFSVFLYLFPAEVSDQTVEAASRFADMDPASAPLGFQRTAGDILLGFVNGRIVSDRNQMKGIPLPYDLQWQRRLAWRPFLIRHRMAYRPAWGPSADEERQFQRAIGMRIGWSLIYGHLPLPFLTLGFAWALRRLRRKPIALRHNEDLETLVESWKRYKAIKEDDVRKTRQAGMTLVDGVYRQISARRWGQYAVTEALDQAVNTGAGRALIAESLRNGSRNPLLAAALVRIIAAMQDLNTLSGEPTLALSLAGAVESGVFNDAAAYREAVYWLFQIASSTVEDLQAIHLAGLMRLFADEHRDKRYKVPAWMEAARITQGEKGSALIMKVADNPAYRDIRTFLLKLHSFQAGSLPPDISYGSNWRAPAAFARQRKFRWASA